MNIARYSTLYGKFHGCNSFRNEQNLIVLDFIDMDFDPWSVLQLYQHNRICMDSQQPFIQALKVFFKTEAPVSVMCKDNSWTALLGSSKTIMPMVEESATFQLYATPFFVKDPASVKEYLQGLARPASEYVFMYKNCVLYLDQEDLPYPGGFYFGKSGQCMQALYRICLLSNESLPHVLSVAQEWKTRREILTLPFITKETIAHPKMIPFQRVGQPYLPEEKAISTGMIQKRLCMQYPHLLIQDILNSYYRNYLYSNNGTESIQVLNQLGLIIEWPFYISYEGTRPHVKDTKEYVSLVVNGHRPTKVLHVRYPFDVYTEYNEVPIIVWTPVYYVNTFLTLPEEVEKVSVDSTVIGYVYRKNFFCFSFPVLEGRPTLETQRNMQHIFSIATLTEEDKVLETFQYNHKYSLHRINKKGIPYHAWCLTQVSDADKYPAQPRVPKLVNEWLHIFNSHVNTVIDVKTLQMALTLARHKICFKTKLGPEVYKEGTQIMLSDKTIELTLGKHEVNFINSIRVTPEENDTFQKSESNCIIS